MHSTWRTTCDSASAASVQIVQFDVDSKTENVQPWNDYLESYQQHCGGATFYHRVQWEKVFAIYNLKLLRLMALRDGKVVGVLPLVWQKHWLLGNQLVSLPWFDSTGILADDAEARDALLRSACLKAEQCGAATLHLRQNEPVDDWGLARTDKVTMCLRLESDPDVLWQRLFPRVRNRVRKAEQYGLQVEAGGTEFLSDLYRVYSTNMRDLGSPSHSRRFLQTVLETFPDETHIHVVRLGKKAIGAAMTLAVGQTLEIPWVSCLRTYNLYCASHQLYWAIVQQACRDGFRQFDFGRSTVDSGTFVYKQRWGAEPVQLYWYTMNPRDGRGVGSGRPEESFSLGRKAWTFLPLWLSRAVGPRIIRNVA